MQKATIGAALAGLLFLGAAAWPDRDQEPGTNVERLHSSMRPGEQHKLLERFLGKWDTVSRDPQQNAVIRGSAEFSWLMEGRWIKHEWSSNGEVYQVRTFSILGYDNFKKSYVRTSVSSTDTTMLHAEGDLDPDTGAIALYGAMDEPFTGEVGKMTKTVFRFLDDDTMRIEWFDLGNREVGKKVVEVNYSRQRPR